MPFLVFLILIFNSLSSHALLCTGLNGNGEAITSLSSSLSMFDGERCLDEQINGTQVNYMYENPDFCACKNEVKEYKSSIGTFGSSDRVKEIQEIIKKENVKLALKAHKSRLLETQDFSFAIDNMQRKGQVDELAMYRAKECASTKLWEGLREIKVKGECNHLEERIEIYLGRESESPLDDLKNEMIKYADAFNSNKKLSEDHLLPMRAFYSMQVSESIDMDTVMNQITRRGVPLNNFTSAEAHVAMSDFNLNMNGLEPSITNDEANAFMRARDGDLDILRRNPFLRMIIQEGRGDEIAAELNTLKNERDELINKVYSDAKIELENRGLSNVRWDNYPQDIRDNISREEERIKREYDTKTQEILTSDKVMKIALEAQDSRCDKVFDEEKIKELFCKELNPPQDIIRSKIIPEVMKNLDPNEDIFDLFMANNDLFCNPFKRNEVSEIYASLDVDNAFSSYLEDIANGNSEQFETFNNEIAPIVAKYTEEGQWTPENREKLIDELAEFLADKGTLDIREIRVIAGEGEQREAAIRAARELLTGVQETETSGYIDRDLAINLESLVNRPFDNSQVAVHEQDTASGLFRESELGEVGNASSYLLAANTEDVARARVVAAEIETAEREGRPVNREIIAANTYVPRDTTTGEVMADARTIVIPEPVEQEKSVALAIPEDVTPPEDEEVIADNSITPSAATPPTVRREIAQETPVVESVTEEIVTTERRTTTTVETPRRDTRGDELRRLMAEAREEEIRLNERLAELDAQDGETVTGDSTTEADRLRSEINRVRANTNIIRNNINRDIAQAYKSYPDNPAPPSYQNQFVDNGTVEEFPKPEEEGTDLDIAVTGKKEEKEKKGQSSSVGVSDIEKGKGGNSKKFNQGLVNNGLIPGYEEEGRSSCVFPQLVFQYPCYIPMEVFDSYNEIEFETDEKEILKKRNYPSRFVSNLGLEGRTFLVYSKYQDKEGQERVILLTYEWQPKEIIDPDDMNSPSFRSKKLGEILSKRWNPLYLQKRAKETSRIDKVYDLTIAEFEKHIKEREMRKLTDSKAATLLSNTSGLNLRIQKENKEKYNKLRKEFKNSRGQ